MGSMADEAAAAAAAAAAAEQEYSKQVASTGNSVDGLLRSSQAEKALAEALRNPPYGATTAATKDQAAQTVLKAVSAFKEAEIRPAVKALGEDEQFALMK